MDQPRDPFAITKPVSVWNKDLNADFKSLFVDLSKTAGKLALGEWTGAATSAADALSALGLKEEPGALAWLLIRRALTFAIFRLVGESAASLGEHPTEDLPPACNDLDTALAEKKLTLDTSLFEAPEQLSLLDDIGSALEQWLVAGGLSKARASTVAARLPAHFVAALNAEWVSNPTMYEPIKTAVDTPFTRADAAQQAWRRYRSVLRMEVDESVFGETFSLRQVYIPLRAYWTERIDGNEPAQGDRPVLIRADGYEDRHVVDLGVALKRWLDSGDKNDAVRVISGGPGSGKSCCARMFAAQLAEQEDQHLIFVPLHDLDLRDDLESAVGTFVERAGLLHFNPLATSTRPDRLLIIFDGLDELAKAGKVSQQAAQDFVNQVDREVRVRNTAGLKLQVLVSGREVAVQAHQTVWRGQGQLLHVLPYYVDGGEQSRYQDEDGLLEADQRDDWWRKYGEATGRDYSDGMPGELAGDDLQEVTAQPLLNYLVALSHDRGQLSFNSSVNLNEVYADLLEAVHERGYDKPHVTIRDLSFKNFRRVLAEIGLAAWHGEGRTATGQQITEHCKRSGILSILDDFEQGAQEGVTKLLAAFYFRQHSQTNEAEKSFEFTHKSFGEYLAALRICLAIETTCGEVARSVANPGTGWDTITGLIKWAEVFGPSALDEYVLGFVERELHLKPTDDVAELQKTICCLIEAVLTQGMPMGRVREMSFGEATRMARNAETALLVMLSLCARCTGAMSKVNWPSATALGDWLYRLQGQRAWPAPPLPLRHLDRLNLAGCTLDVHDLWGANLEGANLEGANLMGANLEHANLDRARLDRANLDRASLNRASLNRASLNRASLKGASLDRANLDGASLNRASLDGASLDRASLDRASLNRASLKGASLKGANLDGASLNRASLDGASLDRASLDRASLNRASLKGVDLNNSRGTPLLDP